MSMAKPQAIIDVLIAHSLNSQGQIDQGRVEQVIKAFSTTSVSAKTALLRRYKDQVVRLNRTATATITSSTELSSAAKQSIQATIAKDYPAVTTLDWQINPQLVGGFTIMVGDMWYDLSLAHDLQYIREQLSQ